MITRIFVDGFKTLTNFELELKPGLNVLVGPNGSGKTNIVSFFEFLAFLMQTDASEATSRAGGAGAIFRRLENGFNNRIKARVEGSFRMERQNPEKNKPERELIKCDYEYEFCLYFPETRDAVLFESQSVRLRPVPSNDLKAVFFDSAKEWTTDIRITLNSNGSPKSQVIKFNKEFLGDSLLPYRIKKADNKGVEEFLDRFLGPNVALVSLNSHIVSQFWVLGSDLAGGQTYNIIPSRVKQPEDSARAPGISKDGYGLAATIYALKRISETRFSAYGFARQRDIRADKNTIKALRDYLQLVNSAIQNFDVVNDPFDNQLKLKFQVHGPEDIWVPLSQISDGTLKWIALITAALTEPNIFSIEEPENYLHPTLQRQIVTVLREILFAEGVEKITVMTTHSETLLNSCEPHELIITYFEDGGTKAKRCNNAAEVSDEINRTGFGLGYYYLAGSLTHE